MLENQTPAAFRPSKTLKISRCSSSPILDGKGSSPCWRDVEPLLDFSFPWLDETPQKTSFKACYDDDSLYFLYEVDDDSPVYLDEQKKKLDVVFEDRVEVFFSVDAQMSKYYCFEASPTGLVLDYVAEYYRKFDYLWSATWATAKGFKRDGGYSVEEAFSLAEMRKLGILKPDGRILAGLYRADFKRAANGTVVERWISWVDPKIEKEDFHTPQTLGELILVE